MTCRKCGEVGPLTMFKKDPRNKTGHESLCRTCDYALSKAWRARNRERTREQLAEQYWRDPVRGRKRCREKWHAESRELTGAWNTEAKQRLRRGQAHWQRTSRGVLIGRLATPKKDRTYIKDRLAGKE